MKNALVLNVSLKCPLKCAHCCFSSDMGQHACLPLSTVLSGIEQAAACGTFDFVHFVGGDPFLYPEIMLAGIVRASELGLKSGVTTSAYWATTTDKALNALRPLADAGLTELTVSYDDEHAVFVRVGFIINAVRAAQACKLRLRVAVVTGPTSKITSQSVEADLDRFGIVGVDIYETRVNSTGRAAEADVELRQARQAVPDAPRGACKSVLRNFQIDPNGNILPCCGVLPHHKSMQIGNLDTVALVDAEAAAHADPLLRWISLAGPIDILVDSTAKTTEPIQASDFDGICSACDRLFTSPALLERARTFAAERTAWLDTFAAATAAIEQMAAAK